MNRVELWRRRRNNRILSGHGHCGMRQQSAQSAKLRTVTGIRVDELEKALNGSDWLKYLGLVGLALWGGTASHFSRMKRLKQPFSTAELLGEWVICGFAGVMTMLFCQAYDINPALTGAFTGIAGHMGGRTLFLLERRFISKAPFMTEIQEPAVDKW